jgi:hypothetical protein
VFSGDRTRKYIYVYNNLQVYRDLQICTYGYKYITICVYIKLNISFNGCLWSITIWLIPASSFCSPINFNYTNGKTGSHSAIHKHKYSLPVHICKEMRAAHVQFCESRCQVDLVILCSSHSLDLEITYGFCITWVVPALPMLLYSLGNIVSYVGNADSHLSQICSPSRGHLPFKWCLKICIY